MNKTMKSGNINDFVDEDERERMECIIGTIAHMLMHKFLRFFYKYSPQSIGF